MANETGFRNNRHRVFSIDTVGEIFRFLQPDEQSNFTTICKDSLSGLYLWKGLIIKELKKKYSISYDIPISKYFLFLWILKRHLVMFFGGLSSNKDYGFCYNLTCSRKNTFIPSPNYERVTYCQANIGGEQYILGGCNIGIVKSYSVEKYNPIENKWIVLNGQIPNLLQDFSVVSFGKKIYIIGGTEYIESPDGSHHFKNRRYTSNISPKIYSYDISQNPDEGEWREENFRLPDERKSHSSVFFKNKIWIAGGKSYTFSFLSSVISYDITRNIWSTEPSLNITRYGFSLVVVLGELYAVGDFAYSVSIEKLGPDNRWHMITELLENYIMSNAIVHENFIYLYTKTKWDAYDVISNRWISESSPHICREINPEMGSHQHAINFSFFCI